MKKNNRSTADQSPSCELTVNDVWDQFHCPKYVTRSCKTDKLTREIIELDEQSRWHMNYIEKLKELVSDPVTCESVPRICRFLYDYLQEIGNKGYRVKDLPAVMKVLEFLALKCRSIKDYEIHLDRMLDLCAIPPLLEKTSESLISKEIMEQYFTLLGYLIRILPTEGQVLKVHKALHSLLTRIQPADIAAVKLDYCRNIVEKSKLPIITAEILAASLPDMYPTVLELVSLLTSVSDKCCHKMLEAGVLNTLLIRMDLPYATQLSCTCPPDIMLDGAEYSKETADLIINVLWSLMKSILPPRKLPDYLMNTIAPVKCAMWGLRYAFKRQVCYSQHRHSSVEMRNEIAMLILTGFVALPSWNLANSGIADDVILLVGIESETAMILSKTVKIGRSNEDLFFMKVLLLIVTHLAEANTCIPLMIQRKLMRSVLQFANPNDQDLNTTWSISQFWDLWTCALNTLSILAEKIPKEFIIYEGAIRLLMILEWNTSRNFDVHVAVNCTKAICSIVLKKDTCLVENFRQCGTIFSSIKLINYILDFEKITMQHQRILTLLLITVENLMRKQTFYQEMYGEHSIKLTMRLLFQCMYQKDNDFQVDQRLILAIGSYIWECIVWCPTNLKNFIEHGAVYIILDIIEILPYRIQCLFLGLLTDMCDNIFCGSYLCTWRGSDKKTGLMSLLARIWREEENRIGIKGYVDDSNGDEELPQMSGKQWLATYHMEQSVNISPAILDTLGSVRSKIYSIRKIIERDNERYEKAKEHYKILLNGLSVEDRITISCVDLYFQLKLGQMWVEIAKYLEQIGIIPLGMDGQAIFLMMQRYRSWGILMKERQAKLEKFIKSEEEKKEKDEYARLRDSKLAPALDAFNELDYIRRTTDRAYMLKKNSKQKQEVNFALHFPTNADVEHCHRTFQDKINVTAVFNQCLSATCAPITEPNLDQPEILPVSPSGSYTSEKTYSTKVSHSLLLCNCSFKPEESLDNV